MLFIFQKGKIMIKIFLDFDKQACEAVAKEIDKGVTDDSYLVTIDTKTTDSKGSRWSIIVYETKKDGTIPGPYMRYMVRMNYNTPYNFLVKLLEKGDIER